MAKIEQVVNIKVEGGGSVKTVKDIRDAVKETEKEVDNLNKKSSKMTIEDEFKALKKQIDETPTSIRGLNKQIQEYQAIALKAGRTSPVGKAALKEAANLKDQYIDIQNEVNRLANDGVKLQAALDLGSTVIGGFAAFQGTLALAGVESEEFQETLIKLQGAQAALVGIETIRKNLEKESTLVLVAKNAAEKASVIGTKALTAAQWLLNAAMNANPLFLLGTVIVGVIAGIAALTGSFKKMIDVALKPVMVVLQPIIDGLKAIVGWFTSTGSAASAASKAVSAAMEAERKEISKNIKELKNRREELDRALSVAVKGFDREIALAKAAGKETVEQERLKLQAVITAAKERAKILAAEIKQQEEYFKSMNRQYSNLAKLGGKNAKIGEKVVENTSQAIIDNTKLLEDSILALEVLEVEQETKSKDRAEQAEKDRQDKARAAWEKAQAEKKRLDDLADKAEKERQQRLADQVALKDKLELEAMEDGLEKQEALRTAAFDKEIADLEAKGLLTNEIELLIRKQYLDDLAQLQADAKQKELDAFHAQMAAEADARAEADAKQKELDDKKDAEDEARLQARIAMTQDAFSIIGSIAESLNEGNERQQKKAFQLNKALNIAQAVVNTSQAVTGALAEPSIVPGARFLKAAAAAAAGVVQIQKIKNTQFNGAGGGSNSVAVPSGAAPRLNQVTSGSTLVNNPNENLAQDIANGVGRIPVVVTETDITNTQNKVKVIENQATVE